MYKAILNKVNKLALKTIFMKDIYSILKLKLQKFTILAVLENKGNVPIFSKGSKMEFSLLPTT